MPTVETNRSAITRTRVVQDPPVDLQPGQARLRVDAFGLTANNVTYAVFGDMLRYWEVFPALDSPTEWGRVPAWGFAEVVETRSDAVAVGERLYGFVPMSDELVITPGKADAHGLTDVAAHRAGLFGTYNRYQRTASRPQLPGRPRAGADGALPVVRHRVRDRRLPRGPGRPRASSSWSSPVRRPRRRSPWRTPRTGAACGSSA